MPTIKTIKPAGDGDFTTLALWEDFADGESTADQHAECYTGGNLGAVTLSGWSSTPDSDNFPKIYAADGHGHEADVTAGAYVEASTPMTIGVPYTQIDGLRVTGATNSNTAISFLTSGTSRDCRVDNCIIHGTFQYGIFIGQSSTGVTSSNNVTNNIIIIDGTAGTTPAGIYAYATDGSGGVTNMFIYNNSIYVANPGSVNNYGIRFANTASCTLNITVENNVIIGAVTSSNESITYAFNQITFDTGSKQFNNNISSDGTADDFSGLNHQINATASNVFKDAPNNSFALSKTSLALDAGKTVSSVTVDMLGVARPQGTAYDIGALEKLIRTEIVYGVPKPFTIPNEVISSHEHIVDSLISGNTGQNCQLIYPITKNSVCPNCIYSPRQKRSSNIYKTGGPVPFENHTICPWCGGEGRTNRAIKEDVRLRVYWTPRDWSITGAVENPDTAVMIIGRMHDLPKIEKCDRILLNKDLSAYRKWVCEREGEAVPWGLAQDKYFAQMLRRVKGG
tara:strand:- start:1258 stop:2784 length:1527 start_codon:yes stop_codon:yes gene_type:complete